ncbi:MAG: LysR family transcriptional regulator [Pseudomonadota bacterium]
MNRGAVPMHLKLRDLMVFQAVMDTGSVSKAADRLGLSQPAVSIALKRLEDTIGFALFNRSKGHFAPKSEAKLLHEDADLAIMALEKFASRAQLIGRGVEGLVRVGSIGSTAIHFMPEIISRYSKVREHVEVELQVLSSAQISYFVSNDQIDIGIVEAPVTGQSVHATNISIPCVCILRKDDPLAEKDVLTPRELADQRLISVVDGHPLDRQIRTAFVDAGINWRSQIRCFFFAIMRNLVAKGAGIAIVDAINGCSIANDDVVWRRFAPDLTYELALITKAAPTLQAPASAFLDMTHEALEEIKSLVAG